MPYEIREYNCPILEEWGIHWLQSDRGEVVCTEFCTKEDKCILEEMPASKYQVKTQIARLWDKSMGKRRKVSWQQRRREDE